MKKFFLGLLVGAVIGVGIGWLAFTKEGQAKVDKEVKQIEQKVDKSLEEVDRKIEEAKE